MPVNYVLQNVRAIREQAGAPPIEPVLTEESVAFYVLLRRLARALAALAQLIREFEQHDPTTASAIEMHAKSDQAEELLEWAYIYARRLGDRFALVARQVLFTHYRQAPPMLKGIQRRARTEGFGDLAPLVPEEELKLLIKTQTGWFDRLRAGEDGIRDLFEHKPGRLVGGGWREGEPKIERWFYYRRPSSADLVQTPELISTLVIIVESMANFFTGFCRLIRWRADFQRQDWFWDVDGDDSDYTRFWPEL